MEKMIDVNKETNERLVKATGAFYDQMLLNAFSQATNIDKIMFGEITGYRKVKVPKYLWIKIPIIKKDYDDDSEYGDGSFKGFLITTRDIKLFRIGTEIEKRPIRKRSKGGKVVFRRYAELSGIPKDVLK